MTDGTTLVLGGARSGKSRRAQALTESLGERRAIVVTAEALDGEMRERIARHRADRDASWRTVEAPLALPETLRRLLDPRSRDASDPDGTDTIGGAGGGAEAGTVADAADVAGAIDVVLVDCLTLWLSNLLLGDHDPEAATERLLEQLLRPSLPLVLVSNEVGFGLVPETPLGRRFRDAQGRLNQRVADRCERVELVVAGQALVIRDTASPGGDRSPGTAPRGRGDGCR